MEGVVGGGVCGAGDADGFGGSVYGGAGFLLGKRRLEGESVSYYRSHFCQSCQIIIMDPYPRIKPREISNANSEHAGMAKAQNMKRLTGGRTGGM